MTWILAGLLSALFIGVHDLFVIHAVRDNAVLPVLFPSTLTGATGGDRPVAGASGTTRTPAGDADYGPNDTSTISTAAVGIGLFPPRLQAYYARFATQA